MILSETLFVAGKPVGVVRQDTNTKQIAFFPTEIPAKLKSRHWRSVDQLKNAVIATYKNTGKNRGSAGIRI